MLDVNQLTLSYGAFPAVKDISLKVETSELVCIIGSNGAGKTSLLKGISGLLRPSSGSIHFFGKDLSHLEPNQIAALGLAHSPEGRKVFTQLRVIDNLHLGAYTLKDRGLKQRQLSLVFSLFPRLKEKSKSLAGLLSGGEQQMLSIGRALMSKPKLLILDEPTMGLAPAIIDELLNSIQTIKSEEGLAILLVEQMALRALKISDRGYVFEQGRVLLSDTAANLLASDQVKKAYLGQAS